MASVRLERLSKTYRGGVAALADLTLTIPNGEFVCILGPSGSGKSTALKLLAGIEEATSGRIFCDDEEVTLTTPERRDVAMVFQSYGLYPQMTVAENIAFPLMLRKMPKGERTKRVEEVCKLLGIGKLLRRYPRQLSGGQRQRVALGRAIVRNPRVFLLDEPLSNLDAKLRSELRAELLALHRALGATMVYVTHDQAEAMTMGQRIAVLHEGRLRQLGTPAEVYQRPADVFVARFIGSPGMNVLAGRGTGMREGGGVVDCGSLSVPVALEHYEGEIHLGVRPEHGSLCGEDQGMGNAEVVVVEPLGAETLVHLAAGGQPLIARLPGLVELRTGDHVGLKLDRRRLHLFDVAGERLA